MPVTFGYQEGMATNRVFVTNFYHFFDPAESKSAANVEQLRTDLKVYLENREMRGLIIMGLEGVNATLAGYEHNIPEVKAYLEELLGSQIVFKDSQSDKWPFLALELKIKTEIVTFNPGIRPSNSKFNHLAPKEWHEMMKDQDAVVVDTRNYYETKMGIFKNAIDPKIDEFHDFPKAFEKLNIPKNKKVMIYCTGGIRCEKAIFEVKAQGFENVYQLDGGILKYIEEMPNQDFEGDCFVFDRRIAVDQNLQPVKGYEMCPHCGDPGNIKIDCVHCEKPCVICDDCNSSEAQHKKTCSKNCSHHHRMGHTCHKKYSDRKNLEVVR